MLESDKSRNLNKGNDNNVNELDTLSENVKRIINTEKEKELEREEQIKENTKGIRFKYLFAIRFGILCNDKFIITGNQARDKLDIDPSTFSKYKSGAKFPSSINELIRLATKLDVSSDYLIGVTDSKSPLPQNMNMELGLSEKARTNLYTIYHYIQDDVQDIDIDLPHSNITIGMLENFSLFIENFSDFCDYLTYMKRYVEIKQEIIKLEENKENTLGYEDTKEHLNDILIRN
ncbi:MAG: hypothetical protein HFJ24_08125 [Clostridia bacterium]|nr:hypothetical protein [Clostridia bacterium]